MCRTCAPRPVLFISGCQFDGAVADAGIVGTGGATQRILTDGDVGTPLTSLSRAALPMAMLSLPPLRIGSAEVPTATLESPLVFVMQCLKPRAVLSEPDVLALAA